MKIVVLDGSVLCMGGDINWDEIKALGECEIYDKSSPEEMLKRCKDADAVITNKVKFSKEDMEKLPSLKYIGVTATGYNIVDVEAARERGITVTNVPAYSTDAVAQHAFALILETTNQVALHASAVRNNEWATCPDFCFWKSPLYELSGKTLGIYGMGHIGRRMIAIAKAFGMNVIFYSRSPKSDVDAKQVSFEELLKESDYLSLHTPLSKDNEKLFNRETISKMKEGAVLINCARGGLIDHEALYEALKTGKLRAAGVDVLPEEPPKTDDKLYELENLFITPHIAWAPKETRKRLMHIAVENLKAFIEGRKMNVVS